MSLRYYDRASGTLRLKRRYVWGFWAYLLGVASGGLMLLETLQHWPLPWPLP